MCKASWYHRYRVFTFYSVVFTLFLAILTICKRCGAPPF